MSKTKDCDLNDLGVEETRRVLDDAVPADECFGNGVDQEQPDKIQSRDSAEAFPCTDFGNAQRLVAAHGQDLRYCHPWRKWLIWDGRRWRIDDTAEVERRAKAAVRAIYNEAAGAEDEGRRKDLGKWARSSESKFRIAAMIALATSEAGVTVLPSELDTDPWLLNVMNGTIALRTGDLREHRREDMITKLAPVPYDPNAKAPLWVKFLHDVMNGDNERIEFLQRAVGKSLTGVVRDHVLLFMYGTGRNGKSKFIGTIQAVLGPDYAIQAAHDILLTSKGTHPTALTDLFGKRFVATIEVEEGRRLAEALVKQVTGGDRIRARRMKEDFWEFDPTHKVWLAANHKPAIKGTDHAIWSRIVLVPWEVRFVGPDDDEEAQRGAKIIKPKDPSIGEKLLGELPGILAWAVRGCLLWQREGLHRPKAVEDATRNYRAEEDQIGAFIGDVCVDGRDWKGKRPESRASDLYAAYRKWAADVGGEAVSAKAFKAALEDRGFEWKHKDTGSYYIGLGLRAATDGT